MKKIKKITIISAAKSAAADISTFYTNLNRIVFVTFIMSVLSCKKSIEVGVPFTSFNGANVYTTNSTAISAVTSLYTNMSSKTLQGGLGLPSLSFIGGLSADELTLYSPSSNASAVALYTNTINATNAPSIWSFSYQAIYQANAAIEGLNMAKTLADAVRNQLLGEAKFVRAFYYFYLTNLYGDVPLVLTTDFKVNSLMMRTSAAQVKQQIVADLLDAKQELNINYVGADVLTSSIDKVRPNKWTATTLLARMYLYMNDYANAEVQSTEVLNSGTYSLAVLNGAFLKNNSEAIWQLQPVNTGWNTEDARTFILPVTGPNTSSYPVYISKRLQFSFESGDARKWTWMDSVKVGIDTFYYSHKYKSATQNATVTEFNTVFRLAELYLIRSEARAQQDNLGGAISDLDVIRKRAGLPLISIINPSINKADLITAIFKERRSEFFTEWGHRWLDLKRSGAVDQVMKMESPIKGGTWYTFDQLYPLPSSELLYNPNLTQTLGY